MTVATPLLLLLIVASVVALLARRRRFPYTVTLVLAGLALGALDEITDRYRRLEATGIVGAPPVSGVGFSEED